MNQLWLRNRQKQRPLNLPLLRRIAQTALRDMLGLDQYQLAVHLLGPRAIARLNQTFLGHDGPTDVITFNHAQSGESMYGEIFVCPNQALLQSRRFQTTWQSELVRYLVHGMLHLTGFDDKTPVARRKLKRRECRILRRLAALFPLNELGKKRVS